MNAEDDRTLLPLEAAIDLSIQSKKNNICVLRGSKVKHPKYKDKKILAHGLEVGKQLAFVLSGGNTTIDKQLVEEDIYALELEAFMKLIETKKTQDRIKHTLSTGKPLVN